MRIVGITGTLGAGKGTIVEYLVSEKGFRHYSVRQYLTEIIEKRGLPVNRDSMVIAANRIRAEQNPAFIIRELYKKAEIVGKDAVIESIRTPGEVKFLRQQGNFILLAVDADPKTRYERIIKRKSSTDDIDFKTFIEDEEREMTSNDPNNQNIRKCFELADIILTNNGSIKDLYSQVETRLGF
jgi:dephospho-CoA kinase